MRHLATWSTSMSKIFDESLLREAAKEYWKRFAASATAFADRYRYEPFFQTEVNVLALQIAFGLLILGIVAVSFSFLYQDIIAVLTRGIEDVASARAPASSIGSTIASELEYMRSKNVSLIVLSIIVATVCFSYIIARLTLSPVRNALQSQKQFIGNVAHELRTPLSTVKTNTEVALFDDTMKDELRDTLMSNIEELDRISNIINNLLSLSASVRPERIEFKSVDLGTIVESVVEKLRSLASRKQLEVTVRMSERRAVWGNGSALEQIVSNILKNAIRFTPHRGRIAITIQSLGSSEIELSIQDSGSGIPRKDLFHVFEPFYRADSSRTRARGEGSGLGLTIVSELVKLHNGKITVRSAEGRGTSVLVLLPAAADARQGEPLKDEVSEIAVDFSHRGNRS